MSVFAEHTVTGCERITDAGSLRGAPDAATPSRRFRLTTLFPALVSMLLRRRNSLNSTGPESTQLRCRKRSAYAGTASGAPNAPCVHWRGVAAPHRPEGDQSR